MKKLVIILSLMLTACASTPSVSVKQPWPEAPEELRALFGLVQLDPVVDKEADVEEGLELYPFLIFFPNRTAKSEVEAGSDVN